VQLRPFALERFFARYEFSVEHVLCASDCETRSVRELAALEPALPDQLMALRLGYVDSRGAASLRATIASLYSSIDPAQVLVFCGAQEAIFWFYTALLKSGDEVVVHAPCYESHLELPRGLGATVRPWFGDPTRAYRLELGQLAGLVSDRTRAIVVNTPHNPTGYSMPVADFEAAVGLATERRIHFFCDEVFRESEHDPATRLPAACDLSPYGVSLGVVSKTYGLAGLRVGWIATKDRALYQRLAELKDYTTICGSAPSELLAEVALRHRQRLAEENVALIRSNLDQLDRFFAQHRETFQWDRPSAGTVAFVGYRGGDVDSFCNDLVEQTGVLLMPGTLFGDLDNRFRIGFGRRNLSAALDRLQSFLRERSPRPA
jgi:aspartate/methionine/tyrosine aminotransferase